MISDQRLLPIKGINASVSNEDGFVGKYFMCTHTSMDHLHCNLIRIKTPCC